MAKCLRCGSIRTRVVRGGLLQRVVALVLGQHIFVCNRCGWRGRATGGIMFLSSGGGRGASRPVRPPEPDAPSRVDLRDLDRELESAPEPKPSTRGTR